MNIKTLRIIPFLAALLSLPALLSAQCLWQLDMSDSFGDGWNGGVLTITTGSTSQEFYLTNTADDGIDSTVYFLVTPGASFEMSWESGNYDEEVGFSVINYDGVEVFAIDPGDLDQEGVLFTGTGVCPACVLPVNIVNESIYDKRAKIKWTPGIGSESATGWWVIYGPEGFTPGPGVGDTAYVSTPKVTLTGLTPKTKYSYYVKQNCGGSNSNLAGPFHFETYWSNDVAVTGIVTPQSDCELGIEVIRFQLSNPGANPQTLIPYTFLVNGQPGGVPQPEDGYYTGVIGKDSTEVIAFETTYNFSDPGEYEITVITQMTGDEDLSNDTLRYYINNVLTAPYAQSYENWNGGWTTYADPLSGAPSTWEHGSPAATIINAAGDGQKAWVTNLEGGAGFSELSYIQSTCFDFSTLPANTKPAVEFLINYSCTEGSTEGAFLETSIDGGDTWTRVGETGSGLNWYNNEDFNAVQKWSGNSGGWIPTHHLVNGVAGQNNVLFRFGYQNGFFSSSEGVGIDQFKVLIPLAKDAASVGISTLGDTTDCGMANDKVRLSIVNVGGGAIPSGYTVYYSVNGAAPVSATINNNLLAPDENFTFTFTPTFDSRDAISEIKCWIAAPGDLNHANDTFTYVVNHLPRPVPFQEGFDAATTIPQGWTIPSNAFVTNAHNNTSNVLAINLYSFNNTCTYITPRFGVIGANDSLRFDYRLTNWSPGTIATALTNNTNIKVEVSTDCGSTFTTVYTIDAATHVEMVPMQTRKVSLAAYAGQSIKIRFVGTWGAGDFWFDLDNVGVIACAADMQLTADVIPVTPTQGGIATVNVGLGNPPYQYVWSTGATTQTVQGLPAGTHTVTVTDSNGCSGVLDVSVEVSGTSDIALFKQLSVRPNPTSGSLLLDAALMESSDIHIEILNYMGQRVWAAEPGITSSISEQIDLSAQPAGMYLLRISADSHLVTKKVIKQ